MVTIGFTGTRNGMSKKQKEEVTNLIQDYLDKQTNITIIHGDCVGADADFHEICSNLSSTIIIKIYPGKGNTDLRAYCKSDDIDEPKPYLQRNRDIVDNCDILFACPISKEEHVRSGTWYTIRYARKVGRTTKIIV